MNVFRRLDDQVLVAGQICPGDIAAAAADGVTTIVNNRPDGEEPGQPGGAAIEAAALAAGLNYLSIPVAGGFSSGQVSETAAALEDAPGRVLMFCRSGTRSAYLWALARASRGVDSERLAEQAAAAGYDLTPILPHLRG